MKRRIGRDELAVRRVHDLERDVDARARAHALLDPLLLLLVGDDRHREQTVRACSDFAYASASSTPRCTLPTSTTTVWFMRRGL